MSESILIVISLIVFAVVARRSREHALAILIFALPLYLVRFAIGPLPSTLLEGMILILFAVWVFEKGTIGGAWQCVADKLAHISKGERTLHLFLFLFVFSATISIAFSPDPRAALGVWRAYFIEPALFFIVFLDTVKTREQMRRMISASIASGALVALLAVYQKLTGWNIPAPWADERRVTSIFPYPNAVGLYLAPLVWLALGRVCENIHEKKIRQSIGALLLAGLLILALTFSKTEGALVALAATALLAGIFWSAKTRVAGAVLVLCAALFFFSSPHITSPIVEKLFLRDWSGYVRITTWQETAALLMGHPLTGAGLAGYQSALAPYHTHEYIEIFLYPHTIIFNFWSETGLYGLASFFLVCVALFALGVGALRRAPDDFFARVTGCALLATLATILIHGLVDVPYFKNDLAVQFWFLAGSTVIIHRLMREA